MADLGTHAVELDLERPPIALGREAARGKHGLDEGWNLVAAVAQAFEHGYRVKRAGRVSFLDCPVEFGAVLLPALTLASVKVFGLPQPCLSQHVAHAEPSDSA